MSVHAPATRLSTLASLRVSDAMTTGLIRCRPDASLRAVARLMAERRVHAVYVFDYGVEDDETTELWGLVSDLDLVAAARGDIEAETARDVSITPLVTVDSDDSLDRASRLMAEYGVSHLAVIDALTKRPIGVLSTLDIAAVLAAGGGGGGPAARTVPGTSRALTHDLDDAHIAYELIPHRRAKSARAEAEALGVSPSQVAKTVILKAGDEMVRAVVPATKRVDLHKVRRILRRLDVVLATEAEIGAAYPEFELGAVPPLRDGHRERVLVDVRVCGLDFVLIEAGTHAASLRIRTLDLLEASNAEIGDLCAD